MNMTGTYDLRLVALSVVIAIFASYAALDLAGRVTAARGGIRLLWLVSGATAMGLGIWSMHYIGMLAFSMPMKMYYDPPTVLLSLFAAIAASAIALYTVSRPRMDTWQAVLGSLFMGSGIAAMHYIGMAAMRVDAVVRYDLWLVAASILLAIVISLVALMLTFRVREERKTSPRKLISAVVMGSAIPVMHYTGMWAANFTPLNRPIDLSHAVSISSIGIAAIAASSLMVLTLITVSAFLDRLWSAQKAIATAAQEGERYFRTLADAIPQIIWTSRPDGSRDFYNKRWYDYTGKLIDSGGDSKWEPVLHPDDRAISTEKWRHAVETGEAYEIEYRFKRASDGTFRWHLGRAVPVRDSAGKVVKWFGSCTDIDDQKRNQEDLEEKVRLRTAELVEINAQLTTEMRARESTQKELDRQAQQLVVELTERSKKTAQLTKMGELLQSCNAVQEAFSIVSGFAPRMFPELRGAVILLNASRNLLEVVGTWQDCQLASEVFDPNACWALRVGRSYLIEPGETTVQCTHANGFKGSYLCIPVQAHGETLGVIHFQATTETRGISEEELTLAGTFAEQVALSISNIRLREALRSQSIRDSVTGLFNRRYLEETLEREVVRAARTGQSLGVVMLDLDHFKRFNDTFGHDAGDFVLHNMGVFFAKHTRVDDIACRYGGEEFVLILPTSNAETTQMRAEQLRSGAKELNFSHRGKPLGVVSISAGVAVFPLHGSSPKRLMEAADAALYEAKKSGRDRVVVAESSSAAGAGEAHSAWA